VENVKALRVEKFESEFISGDGEMRIRFADRDGLLCVKYVKDIYCDGCHYYIVPHEQYQNDKCFEEVYRDFLCDLPETAKKAKWLVVEYERARCRNCFYVYKPTAVETELHGTQYVFEKCPRCGCEEYDLTTESYLEVH
jgi:RNase P subunit RPR2